ncbi:unnamed protein product [Rotaria sp. Silwood2]|nr:unnamed protein product [Rotaria sp. Silwood2]CAF3937108.1 unnamed protein product [Rotaria sp. Silwood2]
MLTLSLICFTDARPRERYLDNALREQILDYLVEAKREELLHNNERHLEDQVERRRENQFESDEDNDSNNSYKRTYSRRKIVGHHGSLPY